MTWDDITRGMTSRHESDAISSAGIPVSNKPALQGISVSNKPRIAGSIAISPVLPGIPVSNKPCITGDFRSNKPRITGTQLRNSVSRRGTDDRGESWARSRSEFFQRSCKAAFSSTRMAGLTWP